MGDVQTEALTFEKVWALLQESLQASREENDRRWAEQRRLEAERREEETERWAKETKRREEEAKRWAKEIKRREEEEAKRRAEETKRREVEAAEKAKHREEEAEKYQKEMKELNKRMGYLDNRFGELAEHLVAPNILEKFNVMGFNFEQMSQDIDIRDASNHCIAEIDIMLENNEIVMAVEIKSKPGIRDVNDHIKRMEILRDKADSRRDTRQFRGAIAGAIMKENVRNYAYKAGLYIIEQTGDTVKITIPENFMPRIW